MNTVTTEPEHELDLSRDQLPGRPRRKLLTKLTVPLLGLLLAAAGFLGGIEVQKSHGTNSTGAVSASTSTSALAKRFAAGTSGTTSGASARKSGSPKSRSRTGGAPSGSTRSSAGSFGAAGGGTTGTISSISGKSIVLKTTSGNSITVTLTSATTLKKNLTVSRNSIRPGDTISVEGITGKDGSVKASSISDSGTSSSSSASSSSSTS